MKIIDAPFEYLVPIYIGEIAKRDIEAMVQGGKKSLRPYHHQEQGFYLVQFIQRIRTPFSQTIYEFIPSGAHFLQWLKENKEVELGWIFNKIQRKFKLHQDRDWLTFTTVVNMFTLWLEEKRDKQEELFTDQSVKQDHLAKFNFPFSILALDILSRITQEEIDKTINGINVAEYDQAVPFIKSIILCISEGILPEEKTGRELLEEFNDGTIAKRLGQVDWTKSCSSDDWIRITIFITKVLDYLNALKTGKKTD